MLEGGEEEEVGMASSLLLVPYGKKGHSLDRVAEAEGWSCATFPNFININ
jgi:hypothetical protein